MSIFNKQKAEMIMKRTKAHINGMEPPVLSHFSASGTKPSSPSPSHTMSPPRSLMACRVSARLSANMPLVNSDIMESPRLPKSSRPVGSESDSQYFSSYFFSGAS